MLVGWGPWYIKPRSLHWWKLFCYKVMNVDPIRFKRMLRIYMGTINFLCSTQNDDLVYNPPHAFEVGICRKKLEVEK
jgi:hypothetical protein